MRSGIAAVIVCIGLAGCKATVTTSSAAALSCDQLAEKAKASTQSQGTAVDSITDVHEISATPAEKRCSGTAHTAQGSNEVYFRGLEKEDSVEIREQPFE